VIVIVRIHLKEAGVTLTMKTTEALNWKVD
jgi:hypothetical protein